MQAPSAYAELHCLSNFSFLRAASFPEEWVQRAIALGYRALAITDECSISGVVLAHTAVKAAGDKAQDFKLLIGSEFATTGQLHLVLLAKNRLGYGQLCAVFGLRLWLAAKFNIPICAAGGVQMHDPQRRPLRDTLTAVRLGKQVSKLGFELPCNGQHYLRGIRLLSRIYPAQWLAETLSISQQCQFSLNELRNEYPHELVPAAHTLSS
jgi:error-prone DNA polymerase